MKNFIQILTNVLEARDANLTDCFIGLIKLGAKINQISFGNPWKSIIISNYNCRLGEFINRSYILAYWLHPLYRGMGLKQAALNEIYETASIMWHNLGHKENTEIENELSTSLNINQFVDLTLPAFLTTGNNLFTNNRLNTNIRSRNIGNMEYDPIKLAQSALNEE
ncbi:hypothetical protein Glove_38g5 [Diversispora epigaea]|uniref:Uncharacterized protein n=1 Tax=Diversispora epigaea TaxID=1348612 RepID=A0A397JPW4_9GLOM|nr:hypothetical protein Glove_38g5 [Diversispora epigaea]